MAAQEFRSTWQISSNLFHRQVWAWRLRKLGAGAYGGVYQVRGSPDKVVCLASAV